MVNHIARCLFIICLALIIHILPIDPYLLPEDEGFISPIKDYLISSYFGYRTPIMGGYDGYTRLHKGIDIVGFYNCEINAVRSGRVVEHYPPPNKYYKGHPIYGGCVVIQVDNGDYWLYAHMKETFVKEKQYIYQGDVIGIQGSTGYSSGDHLHIEVIVNPLNYIVDNVDRL